ncbi:MAG: hypothetical protein ABEK42_11995, partial [Thiohalorhabdaceae bacterium]
FGAPVPKGDDSRRASPLLLHVHPVGKAFVATGLFLPAQFLPGNPEPDWRPINQFLDQFPEVAV